MLKRSKRIHGKTAVEKIVKEGRRTPGSFFAAVQLPNGVGSNRYAVVVGKKLEKSSARRNRKRRQIYEALRLLEQTNAVPSNSSNDIVLLVRANGMTATFGDLKSALSTLLSHP